MQIVGHNHQLQCVDLDSLPYGTRGIMHLDKLGFANYIKF